MKPPSIPGALQCAVAAAQAAGRVMRTHRLSTNKRVHQATQHDIKLELDVRCQKLIERTLLRRFPEIPILGEEGSLGNPESDYRWVVDPIDGTVNFTYGIPHACVSIALDRRVRSAGSRPVKNRQPSGYETCVGVVYDPFSNELWTASRGRPSRLNGRIIRVSPRRRPEESIVSLGFAKQKDTLNRMLPVFNTLVHQVRKIRIMGAAALAMVYVASGRMEAYLEYGVRWWDVAAGGLILECAGGDFLHEFVPGAEPHTCRVLANNRHSRRWLRRHF